MTLKKYESPPDPYYFGSAVRHLFQQLHPRLDSEDLIYVEAVLIAAVRDEISERAEPKKSEDY